MRARANPASLLALCLPPLAVLLLFVTVASLESTRDLTAATMRALILQLAALGIAVALPLYVADDLDLSLGAVALLGLIWAVSRSGADASAFFGFLPPIAAVGCAFGAANALLAIVTRAPAAAVTLATGVALTAALSQTNVHLAVPTPHRLTLDGAALAASLVAVAALVALASPARAQRAEAPPPGVALRGPLALLALAAAFSAAAIAEFDPFALPPAVHGAPLFAAIAGPLVWAAVVLLFAALLVDPPRRVRVLLGGTALLVATPTVGLAVLPERVGQLMAAPVICLPLLFAVAGAVGPGAWPAALARSPRPVSPRRRVVAMSVAGALAATAGAMMGAQGVRDAGFLSQGAFLALLPLIALVVSGQHALGRGPARGRRRRRRRPADLRARGRDRAAE
jgi:hypothetical protein